MEEREFAPGISAAPGRFFGVTFRREGHDEDIVQVRWVIKPDTLTSNQARELFEAAPVRLWRDSRDGVVYRVSLESGSADGSAAGVGSTVSFQSEEGTLTTEYVLARALGLASDAELQALVDRARDGAGL